MLGCIIFEDRQVGRDDLRLKLMRKGLSQRSNGGAEQNGVDLREKLSRNSKNPPRYDARGHVPESRSRYDARDKVPESRSRYGLRGRVPESRASTLVSRMPSARSADDLFKLESSRKPYSSWTADGLRHRSPDKLTSVRRDVSPPRTYGQMRSMPSLRSVGTERASSLVTRDAPGTLRTQPYAGKSTISIDTVQPANGVTSSGTVLPAAPVMVCIYSSSHSHISEFSQASEKKEIFRAKFLTLFVLDIFKLLLKPTSIVCSIMLLAL